jgi:hypothetical protein
MCGGTPSAGSEAKTAYESTNHGQIWAELAAPPATGYPATLSAGTANDIVLGTTHDAGGSLTSDAGQTWEPVSTPAVHLSFVGFISPTHVVGLADPNDQARVFLSSNDAGRTWTPTTFPP